MVPISKTFIIRGGVVLLVVLLLGWTVKYFFSTRSQAQAPLSNQPSRSAGSISDPSALANVYAMSAIAGDPKLMELMVRHQLGPKGAKYISQGKMQIVDQTDTSVHVEITFPDKMRIEEIATVAADPGYTPTAAEMARANQRGFKAHAPKFKLAKRADGGWSYELQYHVPYSALPPELLQKIRSESTNSVSHFFDLVPEARADDREVTGEASISVAANYTAEAYKDMDWAHIHSYTQLEEELEGVDNLKSLGADVPLALFDFLEDMVQLKGWNNELGEIEDCAKNPTNPLTQKASHDSNYQHDVMDQLEAADGDVNSTIVPTLASDAAGYLSHFLPFGGGAVTTLVFSTQDDAVSEYANERIEEAGKYVVPCDKETEVTAFGFRPMSGKFEYKYNASSKECTHEGSEQGCNFKTEVRETTGIFAIDPNATEASEEATNVGSGYRNSDGKFENPVCHGETHDSAKGPIKVHVEVGGVPESAVLRLSAEGEWDAKLDSTNNCGAMPNVHHAYKSDGGAGCEFRGVNMVTGGHYSAFVAADQGHGTCTVELERK